MKINGFILSLNLLHFLIRMVDLRKIFKIKIKNMKIIETSEESIWHSTIVITLAIDYSILYNNMINY